MKEESKKKIDLIIKIVLIIIIIILLLHNCCLINKNKEYQNNTPGSNVDIIEITCDKDKCKNKQIESLSFAQDEISVKKGETIRLIVMINPSELSESKLTWKSSDSNIVSVDKNGVVKGINEGSAVITVTSSNGKKATCTIKVVKESVNVQNIKLTPVKTTIDVGSSTQVSAFIEPANATNRDLVWISSDTKIATVDKNGVVKGLKSGTVTITAKTKDGKVVANTTITVNKKEIESLSFTQNSIGIKKGDTAILTVIVIPSKLSGSKLTWKSSDSNIVSVDANGKIKGINVGKATITVTSSNGKTATCIVEVTTDTIDIEEIVLTPSEDNIYVGSTTQVSAVIEPANATNRDLIWTSSDASIATVDTNGIVKGLKSGTVIITAKTKNGKVVASTSVTIIYDSDLSIYDDDHTTLTWNGANDLKIFSKTVHTIDGKIAPESSNVYKFIVKNSTNNNIRYRIKFIETNEYNINMQYKLKKNDTYIIDHYVRPNEINVDDIVLNSGENDTYYLEWKWISSDNDNSIGQNPEAKYGLKIEIGAEGING